MITLIDYYNELQFEAAKEIYRLTCQFFTIKNDIPKAHGSGVLIQTGSHFYCLSAAHVTQDEKDNSFYDIFIPLKENTFQKLGGELTINSVPVEKRSKDRIDIAILKLNKETVEIISNYYNFLQYNEVEISHQVELLPKYLSVGFPASKKYAKYNPKTQKIKTKSFIYTTIPETDKVYKKLNCETFANIIVKYDKNNVRDYKNKTLKVGPDTFGISGSGLWFVPFQVREKKDKIEKKLVGILTEWPIKNRKVWIATRIDVFTEIIRQKYDDSIEKSKIVGLKLNKDT